MQRGLEYRIRRAAAYAQVQDAKFPVVSVRTRTQSTEEQERMGSYAALTHQLGGEFIHLPTAQASDRAGNATRGKDLL